MLRAAGSVARAQSHDGQMRSNSAFPGSLCESTDCRFRFLPHCAAPHTEDTPSTYRTSHCVHASLRRLSRTSVGTPAHVRGTGEFAESALCDLPRHLWILQKTRPVPARTATVENGERIRWKTTGDHRATIGRLRGATVEASESRRCAPERRRGICAGLRGGRLDLAVADEQRLRGLPDLGIRTMAPPMWTISFLAKQPQNSAWLAAGRPQTDPKPILSQTEIDPKLCPKLNPNQPQNTPN